MKRKNDSNNQSAEAKLTLPKEEKNAKVPKNEFQKPLPHRHEEKCFEDGLYWARIECIDSEGDQSVGRTISFRKMIELIQPVASIHFNFCIDPGWVLSQYPKRYRDAPITFVAGADDVRALREISANLQPNVTVLGAHLQFPYGTHHTKLSLFESENSIHVVVMTGNLVPQDWGLKTQALFHSQGKFLPESNKEDILSETAPSSSQAQSSNSKTSSISPFAQDLLDYLQFAYCRQGSTKGLQSTVGYWMDRIRSSGADFGSLRARIVGSVPGRFDKEDISKFGHMRLRSLLSEHFTPEALSLQRLKLAQFSSIGSLGAQPERWLSGEFLSSLGGTRSVVSASRLKLVYPCLTDVKESLEGLDAGLSLPYQSKNHDKQRYLNHFLHKWRSDALKRTHAMPHVKSYAGVELGEDGKFKLHWVLFTSANLSKSAWGTLEKGNSQLFIRSYELGVLIFADHEESDGNLRLPFDLPLTPYGPQDQPFQVDIHYH